MAEDIDGDNLTYSIRSYGKLVCSLIGRIMAEDIDGDNLTYSIASSGKLVCSLIGRIMDEDIGGDNLVYILPLTICAFGMSIPLPILQKLYH